jgi:hypothetical protein
MKRVIVLAVLSLLLTVGVTFGRQKKPEAGPNIYMPYARSMDHLVVGVEIAGYHMRYDIAQEYDFFMALLPDHYDSLDDAPIYFAINTFPFDGFTVKQTFENDLKALRKTSRGLRITKRMDGSDPKSGECYGAELAYPETEGSSRTRRFIFAKVRVHYAIMMTIDQNEKDLKKQFFQFIVWANAP